MHVCTALYFWHSTPSSCVTTHYSCLSFPASLNRKALRKCVPHPSARQLQPLLRLLNNAAIDAPHLLAMANDAVRRIMAEVKEFSSLNNSPSSFFHAQPLESDLFEWHFTVRGPPDTAFEEGLYHGRILLPADYPLKPPEIIMLTPNGRFEVGKRICLSVTAHHQETWQPSWGIRTILTALVGFMPSKAEGVGALDYPDEDRRGLARKSHGYRCDRCGARPVEQLPPREPNSTTSESSPSQSEAGNAVNTVENVPSASNLSATADNRENQSPTHPELEKQQAWNPHSESRASADKNPTDIRTGDSATVVQSTPSSSSSSAQLPVSTIISQGSGTGTEGEPDSVADLAAELALSDGVSSRTLPPSSLEQSAVRNIANDRLADNRETTPPHETKERELLYLAYAIIFLMVAIIARRVMKFFTE